MTGIEVALLAAGAAVSAYGIYESGQARKEAGMYQTQVARNNQALSEQYAQVELARGQRLEDAKRLETAQRQGAVRAAVAANGLDVNSGSPLRLQEDTALLGEYDALTIRSNAARSAHGYRTQGMNYGAQAQLNQMEADSASRAGTLGAWSSIIGGASSVSGKWSKWQQGGGGSFWG